MDQATPSIEAGSGGASAGVGGGSGGASASAGTGGTGGPSGGHGGGSLEPESDAATMHDGGAPLDDGGLDAADPQDAGDDTPVDTSCLADITDYKSAGPFGFETATIATDEPPSILVWLPQLPAGCHAPVVYLGLDTGAVCSVYDAVLENLASHGFIAACFNTAGQTADLPCVDAVKAVVAAYPGLAHPRAAGFMGQGLGGGAAYLCTRRADAAWPTGHAIAGFAMAAEVGAGASMESWMEAHAQIRSPMLVVNAEQDGLVSPGWVREGYEALSDSTEAYWYEAMGATHIPLPAAWLNEASIAWFRWKLLHDNQACTHVRAMPDSEQWDLQEQQNAVDCR